MNFDDALERLKVTTGITKDNELSNKIGLKKQSISAAREKGKIPSAWFIRVAEQYGVSLDWLIFGRGDMYNNNSIQGKINNSVGKLEENMREMELVALREQVEKLNVQLLELYEENRQILKENNKLKEEILIAKTKK